MHLQALNAYLHCMNNFYWQTYWHIFIHCEPIIKKYVCLIFLFFFLIDLTWVTSVLALCASVGSILLAGTGPNRSLTDCFTTGKLGCWTKGCITCNTPIPKRAQCNISNKRLLCMQSNKYIKFLQQHLDLHFFYQSMAFHLRANTNTSGDLERCTDYNAHSYNIYLAHAAHNRVAINCINLDYLKVHIRSNKKWPKAILQSILSATCRKAKHKPVS